MECGGKEEREVIIIAIIGRRARRRVQAGIKPGPRKSETHCTTLHSAALGDSTV